MFARSARRLPFQKPLKRDGCLVRDNSFDMAGSDSICFLKIVYGGIMGIIIQFLIDRKKTP